VHLTQVGEAASHERTHQVECRRGRVVHARQPVGVWTPGLRCEIETVDRVTSVSGQGYLTTGFGVLGARLGVLACDASNLHDRQLGGVGQHHTHRQQDAQLGLDVVGAYPGEGLGAVAALEQEGFAIGHPGDSCPEVVTFAGEDQRR